MSEYRVTVTVDVLITVEDDDPHNVIRRCVENYDDAGVPQEDIDGGTGWRNMFYDIDSADGVMEHLAFNRVANGTYDVRRLDGWADVPEGAATIDLDGESIDFTVEVTS